MSDNESDDGTVISSTDCSDDETGRDPPQINPIVFNDNPTFIEELPEHQNKSLYIFDYAYRHAKTTQENTANHERKVVERSFLARYDNMPVDFSVDLDIRRPGATHRFSGAYYSTPHSGTSSPENPPKRLKLSEIYSWELPEPRTTPLPLLSFANNTEVWHTMVYTDEIGSHTRNSRLFQNAKSSLPRMRAILLDWIMEVCEVYRLRRVSYYLAVDYIDRYLTIKPSIPKHKLQLLGITALLVAAKLEEVYTPKISEFSYVCDGACSTQEIIEFEVALLNILDWNMNPMTPTTWLNLYLQIHFTLKTNAERGNTEPEPSQTFIYPQYSAYDFVRASNLIDLFSLDPSFLLFSYSAIAASAMYFLYGRTIALQVSGFGWTNIKDCVSYMSVFHSTIRDANDPKLQSIIMPTMESFPETSYRHLKTTIPKILSTDSHSLQTHVVNLKHFEFSVFLRIQLLGFSIRKTIMTWSTSSSENESEESSFSETSTDGETTEEEPETEASEAAEIEAAAFETAAAEVAATGTERSETATNETATGEAAINETATGEAAINETATGKAAINETTTDEAAINETATGEAAVSTLSPLLLFEVEKMADETVHVPNLDISPNKALYTLDELLFKLNEYNYKRVSTNKLNNELEVTKK